MYLPPTIYSVLVSIIIFIVSYYRTNTTLARTVLFCAEKRGRFIPCRGGGTATTYYSDDHNVDEDLTTIANQGGAWGYVTLAGVMQRAINDSPSTTYELVASRLIYLS